MCSKPRSGGAFHMPCGDGTKMNSRAAYSMKRRVVVIAVALLSSGLLAAADVPGTRPQALMESNRTYVEVADLEAELAKLNPAQQAQFLSSRVRVVQMLNNLYLNRILASEARALGLANDPVLARQIELQVEKMLAQARLDRLDQDTKASFPERASQFEARAREVYISDPARFRVPEQVHVAHVLVKVGAGGDAAAKARAEEIRARVIAGAAIGDLAVELSDDPSARRNRGDLGMVSVDKLDPAFGKAVLALNTPGEVGPVVKSAFGYHVIQFKGKKAASTRSFDEVKGELVDEVRNKVVQDTRTLHMSLPFEPAPKVNETLLNQLARDSQRAADGKANASSP
jgi:peptidyl-prolyl cis-trans isomerase C